MRSILLTTAMLVATPALAVAPALDDPDPGLVVMRPRVTGIPVDQIDPAALSNLASSLIAGLDRYQVISHEDVVATLDQEAQAQLAGCDETGCMAEVGNALGAPFLFYATVGRVGSNYVVTATLIESSSARVLQRQAITVASVDHVAEAMRVATLRTFGEQAELPRQASGMAWWPFGVGALGVGGLVVAAAAVGTGLALYWNGAAKSAPTMQAFNDYRNQIAIANPLAIAGYVVGGLFVLASPLFFLLPSGQAIEAGDSAPSSGSP
ncbi:MAG: hypothetical protein JXR83_19135 [Deltaproteobacteria bacterium]|nr:hypothetical protein [Deltaproteobacteria bacterium]